MLFMISQVDAMQHQLQEPDYLGERCHQIGLNTYYNTLRENTAEVRIEGTSRIRTSEILRNAIEMTEDILSDIDSDSGTSDEDGGVDISDHRSYCRHALFDLYTAAVARFNSQLPDVVPDDILINLQRLGIIE